jgi:branched-chain amino acid aminotransferase
MSRFQFFAVEDTGPRLLPVPPNASGFADLYQGLPLGVYTALRTFHHNQFLYLDHHLDRTQRSMALLGWDYHLDRQRLQQALHSIVTQSEWPEMRVRIDVLAAAADQLGTASRELIAIQAFTPPVEALYEHGVTVDFAAGLERDQPLAKTADFAAKRPSSAGLQQLEDPKYQLLDTKIPGLVDGKSDQVVGPYEFLLVNAEGQILEGTGTNFWAVRDGVLFTAGEDVLEGITREIILRLLSDLGIPFRLEAVRITDIPALQEAALSGSSRAFLPVINIAGQLIGDGQPGPVSRKILAAYRSFVEKNTKTAIS